MVWHHTCHKHCMQHMSWAVPPSARGHQYAHTFSTAYPHNSFKANISGEVPPKNTIKHSSNVKEKLATAYIRFSSSFSVDALFLEWKSGWWHICPDENLAMHAIEEKMLNDTDMYQSLWYGYNDDQPAMHHNPLNGATYINSGVLGALYTYTAHLVSISNFFFLMLN